jgi:hypothetical protein
MRSRMLRRSIESRSAARVAFTSNANGFAMTRLLQFACNGILLAMVLVSPLRSAERPTLQSTCDPRPDIWSYPWYYAHTEYRREYNRPRYYSGWIAHKIAPTSQEAMVWCENNQAGNYDGKHCPPVYKRYFAPKPWEVLQTGPRPDFVKQKQQLADTGASAQPDDAFPARRVSNKVQESEPILLN